MQACLGSFDEDNEDKILRIGIASMKVTSGQPEYATEFETTD
jgi:hypothetical protein